MRFLYRYITIAGRTHIPEKYIETHTYQMLKEKAKTMNERIILTGPKGCEKSLCQVALLNGLLHDQKNVMYLTTNILNHYDNMDLVKEYLFNKLKDFMLPELSKELEAGLHSLAQFESLLIKFIPKYCQQNPLYLVLDFDKLRNTGLQTFNVLLSLALISTPKLSTIIALSSGAGHDLKNRAYRDGIRELTGEIISVHGFSEKEARFYMNDWDDFNDIKKYCGTNPLLLQTWQRQESEIPRATLGAVEELIREFIIYNLKIGVGAESILNAEKFIENKNIFTLQVLQ